MRMTSSISRWRMPLALVGVAALISACGGDGNDDRPSATQAVPASASQSVAGFIAYLQELVVASADNLEPVDTSGLTAPVDNTGEPVALN